MEAKTTNKRQKHALSAGLADRWKVSLRAQTTCEREWWPESPSSPPPQPGHPQQGSTNRCSRGQVAASLFGTRAMRGAPSWARHLLLLTGRRCALPPSNCTGSSAASNSGAATSSKQGGAPRALGVCRSQVPGGERGAERGTKRGGRGAITVQLGRGLGQLRERRRAERARKPGKPGPPSRTGCRWLARGCGLRAEAHTGPAARGAQQPYAGPGLPLNERAAANGSWRRR